MSQAAIVRAIMRMGQPGYSPLDEIIRSERRRFKRAEIARPGHPLLPKSDWREAIVTLTGGQARILLVDANVESAGSFTRLIASLTERGITPVVVCPTPRFAATLSRRGWRESRHGGSFSTRELWMTPPPQQEMSR